MKKRKAAFELVKAKRLRKGKEAIVPNIPGNCSCVCSWNARATSGEKAYIAGDTCGCLCGYGPANKAANAEKSSISTIIFLPVSAT